MTHPCYHVWRGMLGRCYNRKAHGYANYGGRGIQVCDLWRDDFWQFVADMGHRPEGTTLDRINNDGDYEPGNCRWATAQEQRLNSRQERLITASGVTKTLEAWSRDTGIPKSTLHNRLNRGWTDERTITEPVQPRGQALLPEGATAQIKSLGLSQSTVNSRVRRGWSYQDAISKPVRGSHATRK